MKITQKLQDALVSVIGTAKAVISKNLIEDDGSVEVVEQFLFDCEVDQEKFEAFPRLSAAEIEDEPGGLANLLKHLLDARVHTIYMYAFLNFPSEKAVMIFRFSDTDKAIEVLQEKGVSLLDAKTFGMLGSTRGLPNETNHGI